MEEKSIIIHLIPSTYFLTIEWKLCSLQFHSILLHSIPVILSLLKYPTRAILEGRLRVNNLKWYACIPQTKKSKTMCCMVQLTNIDHENQKHYFIHFRIDGIVILSLHIWQNYIKIRNTRKGLYSVEKRQWTKLKEQKNIKKYGIFQNWMNWEFTQLQKLNYTYDYM